MLQKKIKVHLGEDCMAPNVTEFTHEQTPLDGSRFWCQPSAAEGPSQDSRSGRLDGISDLRGAQLLLRHPALPPGGGVPQVLYLQLDSKSKLGSN